MKLQFLMVLILAANTVTAQEIPILHPEVGEVFNFSTEFQEKFNSKQAFDNCDEVRQILRKEGRNLSQLKPEEKEILKYCQEGKEGLWDIVGSGCSWYCGGGPKEVVASSYLERPEQGMYIPGNAHDLSYKTAWVEGVPGDGIGEYLVYRFAAESPRVTKIIVVNGYVKNPAVWLNNSRVKKLKVYLNNKPYAILILEDVRAEQSFEVTPIGTSDRTDFGKMALLPDWRLKFEILEVYPGDHYTDTVISEIYFDGIDVH